MAKLSRAISAADAHRGRLSELLPFLEAAVLSTTELEDRRLAELSKLRLRLREIDEALNGDPVLPRFEGQSRMSLKGRTDLIVGSLWVTTSAPTGTYERAYEEARDGFVEVLAGLREIDGLVRTLEDDLERAGAPYTPGRLPVWELE